MNEVVQATRIPRESTGLGPVENFKQTEDDFIALAEEVARSSETPTNVVVTVTPSGRKRSRKEEAPEDQDEPEDPRKPVLQLVPAEITEEDKTLLNYIKDGEDPKSIYDRITYEIAEEALHLKFLREAAQAAGLPFSKISRDRVASLKELSDIMSVKAKELASRGSASGGVIDFGSVEFRKVMSYFIAQVMDAAKSASIPDHSIKLMASGIQQRLNGFEEKAKGLYSGAAYNRKAAAMNAGREI